MPDLLPINFGITELPRRYSWRPDQGWRTIRTFRGPKIYLEGILGHEKRQRLALEIDLQEDASPNATLTITYGIPQDGQPEEPNDYWELHGNDIQKSILEHPLYGGLPAKAQAMLRSEIANAEGAEPGTAYDATFNVSPATLVPPAAAVTFAMTTDLYLLYDLWVRDQRHYTESQFVLRKTQTLSSNYQLNLSMAGLNQLWSLTQITNTETIPAVILQSVLNIPDRIVLIPGTAITDTRWTFGWLKRSPTITQRAGNRFEVVQEWWLEVWPNSVYSLFT